MHKKSTNEPVVNSMTNRSSASLVKVLLHWWQCRYTRVSGKQQNHHKVAEADSFVKADDVKYCDRRLLVCLRRRWRRTAL
ncbi:hypothetical protein M378DRAFT_561700 [Amanita muscaria Koide BX008]|uniref:Uncharacterized protein n=1 Tax=Amanita muscaria (strain Koide BX008) TaxID=946122 RepID=A0A0C2W3Z2_AMAMK|nr:hypothetical protein M378DRAFT_561700 [Amanita muscaria Koide BX008]